VAKFCWTGKILIYFKGRKKYLLQDEIGHYSIMPDLTLEIKEIINE